MAEEKTEDKTISKPTWSGKYWWQGDEMKYKNRSGHKHAEFYYKQAVDGLVKLQNQLSKIYKETNLAERQLALKKLEVEYGTKDFAKVVKDLRAQKDYTYNILTSKYVDGKDGNTFEFHNDGTRDLSPTAHYQSKSDLVMGNNLNKYYNPYYDMNSKKTDQAIKKAGVSKEEYMRQWNNKHGFPDDVLQFINPKNEDAYVDPNDLTDLWGRNPSDADWGIHPDVVAGRKNEKKEIIEEKTGTSEFDAAYGVTGEGDGKGKSTKVVNNKIDNNKNLEAASFDDDDSTVSSSDSDTNRSELMSKRFQERAAEIENKPSRIQQGLMEDPRWSSDRLAKLSIKDQDFQKAKGNKELMIAFKKDKAAGVYS